MSINHQMNFIKQSHLSKNLCLNKRSFIIPDKIRQLNVRRADLSSEDTGSIPFLILWAFLTGLLCLLRHLQVTTFVFKFICIPVDKWYIYFIWNSFIYLIYLPTNYRTDYWKMQVQLPSWLSDSFCLIIPVRWNVSTVDVPINGAYNFSWTSERTINNPF